MVSVPPGGVQVNVLDGGTVDITAGFELGYCKIVVIGPSPFLLFFFFVDPTAAPTITARRAKKPMIMIIIPFFVR